MTFRTRIFLAAFVTTALSLAVSMVLVTIELRRGLRADIEATLMREATLSARMLSNGTTISDPAAIADQLGSQMEARVTFIAADGRVVGDSDVDKRGAGSVEHLENHLSRPEVAAALATGSGMSTRASTTTGVETTYAAVAVKAGPVAVVRLGLPLTVVDARVRSVRGIASVGLALALVIALALAWATSVLLSGRLRAIASTADRYSRGDFSRPTLEYGQDEIGTVARVLDTSVRELGQRLAETMAERAKLSTILAGMVEGVVLIDHNRRIALVNANAGRMLSLADDVAGHNYKELIRDPDVIAMLSAAFQGETAAPRELNISRAPNRTFVGTAARVSPDAGGGAVLVLHDVTELRRADQIRRDFVANVSHELRTPLTAVRGYVEALTDSPNLNDTERRRFLDIIARHTMRMERLVHDLLRLARLDAGQELLDTAQVPIDSLISGVETEMEDALARKSQRIDRAIAADAAMVTGDPGKLHDVLRNLVENAINYGPANSAIEIASRNVDGKIEITVSDRGPGIAAADLPRVFERFYRADPARARDSGGTGLGLAIVRHLVTLHGGSVAAEQRPHGGTTVRIVLPSYF